MLPSISGISRLALVPILAPDLSAYDPRLRTRSLCRMAAPAQHKISRKPMDLRKLKTLIDLVSESNIHELEITEAEGKVRIVKASAATPVFAQPAPTAVMALAPIQAHETSAAAQAAATSPEAPEAPLGRTVKSPMVGTFYRSSSPSAKPFAELGGEIQEGEPICIIEAMKIMNEIEADCSGKVTRILCENGQAVEFGQPLFIVE